MNLADTAQLLLLASGYDGRELSETETHAWHEVIGHLRYDDAAEAIVTHYTHQSKRVMPADVMKACRAAAQDRAMRAELPATPAVADETVVQRIRREMPPYEVRDQDGTLLHRGPAKVLAERVRRHADLDARLKAPPLSFTQGWNGYVPPLVSEHTIKGTTIVNRSPIRLELLAIVKEARDRDIAAPQGNHHTTEQEHAS